MVGLAAAALGAAGNAAQAADRPSIYARHDLTAIRNDTSSVLIGDLQEARTTYVLPPATGRSILSSFLPGGNLEQCQTMSDLQATSRELATQMAALFLHTEPMNVELERLRQEKARLREIMATSGGFRLLEQRRQSILLDIGDIEDSVAQLRETCPTPCSPDIQAELDELAAEIAALESEAATLATRAAEQRAAYDDAQHLLDAAEAQEAALSDDLEVRMNALVAAREQVLATYTHYASLTGGSAVLEYQSGWDENIGRLRTANPAFTFRPMPTSEARVVAGLAGGIGRDSYLAMSPSILSYTVNGVLVTDGSAPVPFPEYPKNVRVDATLSLVAACIQHAPHLFDVEKSDANLPLFAMTVTYKYPTVFFADVIADFNLWHIYERIRLAGRGWWSTRVNAVLAGADVRDRIRFDWLQPGTRRAQTEPMPPPIPEHDPAVRREAEQRIVHELIQEIMAMVGEVRDGGDVFARFDRPAAPPYSMVASAYQREPFALRALSSTALYDETLRSITTTHTRVPRLPRLPDTRLPDIVSTDTMPTDGTPPRKTLASRAIPPTRPPTLPPVEPPTLPPTRPPTRRPVRVTIAMPGELGTELTEIAFDDRTTAQQLRVLTTAIQLAKGRRSYECGWYSIWCDGQTWTERVRIPALIRAQLDRWERRRFGRLEATQKLGSTQYSP
jgi:hypothetical protein